MGLKRSGYVSCDGLAAQAKKNTILLANPPFDDFTPQEQADYQERGSDVRFSINLLKCYGERCPNCQKAAFSGSCFRRLFYIATTRGIFENSWSASAS